MSLCDINMNKKNRSTALYWILNFHLQFGSFLTCDSLT